MTNMHLSLLNAFFTLAHAAPMPMNNLAGELVTEIHQGTVGYQY